jgi:hypothetical protein
VSEIDDGNDSDSEAREFPTCSIAGCDRRGVHYFGEMELPVVDTGEYEAVGTTDFDSLTDEEQFEVSEWGGEYESIEYYECQHHYYERNEEPADHEELPRNEEDEEK